MRRSCRCRCRCCWDACRVEIRWRWQGECVELAWEEVRRGGQCPSGWPRPGLAHQLLPETGHPSPSAAIHLDHLPDSHIYTATYTHTSADANASSISFAVRILNVFMRTWHSVRQRKLLWKLKAVPFDSPCWRRSAFRHPLRWFFQGLNLFGCDFSQFGKT